MHFDSPSRVIRIDVSWLPMTPGSGKEDASCRDGYPLPTDLLWKVLFDEISLCFGLRGSKLVFDW